MIPKKLSLIWVGPHDPPTALIDSWEKKHINGWFFTLWRDHKQQWCNQQVIDHFAANRKWNAVADVMRYEILLRGGFVMDADSECLKALDEGPENFLDSNMVLACNESESVRPGMVGCGFLGAPAASPLIQACIDACTIADLSLMPWRCVGPEMFTRIALSMPEQIRVLPAKTANPIHYSGAVAPGGDAVPTYAFQHWGSTKSYNNLRRWPCQCEECRIQMIRCPWG